MSKKKFVVKFGDFELSVPFATRLQAEEWIADLRKSLMNFPTLARSPLIRRRTARPKDPSSTLLK